MAARETKLARAIAAAVHRFDPSLKLYGLSGSELIKAGQHFGLETVSEVFADRHYRSDGSLAPRSEEGAVIASEAVAVAQVLQMVSTGTVTTKDSSIIMLEAETVCIHGDSPHAATLAAALRSALEAARIRVSAP
jgi:UPF0271 protein